MKSKYVKYFYKSGEVTVFLSMMCLVICGLIFSIIKSAKLQYQKLLIEISVESALKSAMSEYNKELFEKYGLLFVDTTYKGVTDGGDESFINHLSQYIDINLEQYNTGGNPLCYISSSVNKSEYADANNHELVANQIVNYMSNIYKDDSSFSDDDLIEKYILLKFGEDVDSENENTIESKINEMSSEEKIVYCVDLITKEMRDTAYDEFNFSNLLSEVSVTVFISTDSEKIYECTKSYTLN